MSHYDKGMEALKSGDYTVAVMELERAAQDNPTDYRVFNFLGAAYASDNRYEKAIGAFKTAEQLAPSVAKIHYNLGQAYEAVGIHTEAEYEYERALSLDPNYANAKAAIAALRARIRQK